MISLPSLKLPGFDGAFTAEASDRYTRHLGRPHTAVMMLLFAGALAIGYVLLPGANERIAMLEQDGRNQQALALLEQRFAAGDRSQRTLFQLHRLYEYFGDLPKAQETLEMLAHLRPKDPAIGRQLVRFYKQTQNETGYRNALARQVDTQYSEPACKELIGYYRANGDFDREQQTLELCHQRGYRRSDDLIRLAYLLAADNKLAQASALLRSVDDRRRLRADRDRRLFFSAMVEDGQIAEAQKRALRWLKGSKDQVLALELIESLVEEQRHDLALDLARQVGAPGDPVSLSVAELLLDRNQQLAARTYLRGWFDVAKLTDVDLTHRFIGIALDADDLDLAYRGALRFGVGNIGQTELASLAEALSAADKRPEFTTIMAAIDPATVRQSPLLAAAIAIEQGATEPARQYLAQIEVDTLDQWRLALWTRLMESTNRRAIAARPVRPAAPVVQQVQGPKAARRLKEAREKRALRRQKSKQAIQQGATPPPALPAAPKLSVPGGGG